MSAKEKYLRRLLRDAEFYLNNIDGDDPLDPIGDVKRAGHGNHPVDTFVNQAQDGGLEEGKNNNQEEVSIAFYHLVYFSKPSILSVNFYRQLLDSETLNFLKS